MKKTINPFLHFNGNCKEAIEYYRDIFNGEIEILMTASQANMLNDFPSKNSILHAVLNFYNGMIIMGADTKIGMETSFGNNNFIVINFESEAEIDRVYALFAKDAMEIKEELHKVFWNAKYAEFVDKFGVCWMFNFDYHVK